MLIIEIIAVVSTLICVYLTTIQNIWCWPVGIVACAAFLVLFISENLYFQSSLQFVFIIQSIIGWKRWSEVRYMNCAGTLKEKKVSHIDKNKLMHMLIGVVVVGIGFGFYLSFSDDPAPYLDGISTTFCILATYLLIDKHIEAWYIWMIVNVILFTTCMLQGLYITAGMEVILFGLSIKGLIEWKRDLKTVSV